MAKPAQTDYLTRRTAELGLGVRAYFEPRDIWLGVYWDREPFYSINRDPENPSRLRVDGHLWSVYVCILPMLPVRFRWLRGDPFGQRRELYAAAGEK